MKDIIRLSENTFIILFEQTINKDTFAIVNASLNSIQKNLADFIIDMIPAYASIHITFNLQKISGLDFQHQLKHCLQQTENLDTPEQTTPTVLEIPVYYGDETGLDLQYLADRSQLSPEDIIYIHSNTIYDIYAVGFAPGFAYLGNVDERIACPRKTTPRQKIPKGSVGIAEQQTAVYPKDSPGGWQIIGRTPMNLIDYTAEKITPFIVGGQVKFTPISRDEYLSLGGEVSDEQA